MNFGEYIKILKGHFSKQISNDSLCRLLFDSIIEPLELTDPKSGELLDYSKGRISEIINGKKPIPASIRDNVYEPKVTDGLIEYFDQNIVLELAPDISDLCHQLMQVVEADPSLSLETKSNLRMLATPNTIGHFLAQTFIYVVRENSTSVMPTPQKPQTDSTSLHLAGIINGTVQEGSFSIDRFSPIPPFDMDGKIDKITDLFNEISDIHLQGKSPAAYRGWITAYSQEPVTIADTWKKNLKGFANLFDIRIADDFFELGDLARDPMKRTISVLNGGSDLTGSDEAIKKYDLIETLKDELSDFVKWSNIENLLSEMVCIRLAVENTGYAPDQDVEVIMAFDEKAILLPIDMLKLDNRLLNDMLNDYDTFSIFGIPATTQYHDFDYSVVKRTISATASTLRPFSFSQRGGERTESELEEAFSEVFCYKYFEENGHLYVTVNIDEVMHKTVIAFPSVILLNRDVIVDKIPYTIRSRQMGEVYTGILEISECK